MIPDKLIIRELKKKKNRVFSLLPTGNSELYINQEVLLMTQIGLFKDTEKNKDIRKLNQIHFKKNFPYKKKSGRSFLIRRSTTYLKKLGMLINVK